MFGYIILKNTFLVELDLPATIGAGQEYKFLDIPQLRGKKITGIAASSADQLAVSPNSKTVVASNGLPSAVVVFAHKTFERVFYFPIYDLVPENNLGLWRMFEPFEIDFNKSYVKLFTTNNVSASEAFIFNFNYE